MCLAQRREAIAQGFNHFKVKVGISVEDDNRRLGLVRSVIDDPANFVNRKVTPTAASLEGKNAGPTGCVLMMDSNQGASGRRYFNQGNIQADFRTCSLGCRSGHRVVEEAGAQQSLVY